MFLNQHKSSWGSMGKETTRTVFQFRPRSRVLGTATDANVDLLTALLLRLKRQKQT